MSKSTKPEGTTSYKETAFGILPRSKIVILEQEGVKKALQYILQLSEKKVKITTQIILDIHKIGFGFIFPDWAGRFRVVDVTVGEYEPAHYSKVSELVKNLCDDLEERLQHIPSSQNEERFLVESISLLAWFQHRFVWIHPFKDYNGRVARLLTNLLILNFGLPSLEIKASADRDRKNYIEAIKAADKNDLSKLEKLIANALKESLEKA